MFRWAAVPVLLAALTIPVAAQTPVINVNGVSNAAIAKTVLARGGLASIYGVNFAATSATFQAQSLPLPVSLGNVSITVGGAPAPLYFVSSGQINFQVPFEVIGSSVNVVVTVNSVASAPVNVAVADYAVGIFGGADSPIALHLDNSLVTAASPAAAGETLVLYATGIGKLNNAPADGAAASSAPLVTAVDTPTVTIGGANTQVLFAGLTPGGVGLSQFDITLPLNLPSSSSGTLPLLIAFPGDSGPAVNLPVKGASTGAPKLSLSVTSLAFGSLSTGQSSTLGVTLNNTGTAPLTVSALTISGAGFSLIAAPQTRFTIAVGSGQTISVQFAPTGAGPANGSLSIVSNDPASPATVSLSGTGTSSGTPSVSVSATALDFGSVATGQTKDLILTVNNSGSGPLTLNGLNTTAPFSVVSPATPLNIGAGGSANVTIRFAPTAATSFGSALTISSNDPAKPTLTVSLTGTGVATGTPSIAVSANSLDFGTVNVGQTKDLTLVVNNTGSAALTVNALNTAAPFSVVSPATPFSIAGGGSASVTIRFAPASANVFSGGLTISSNDPAKPSVPVTLAGTGSVASTGSPAIGVSTKSLSFGTVGVGQSADLTLSVSNSGSASLTVSGLSTAAPFSVVSPAIPFNVAAGASTTVTVRFSPTAANPAGGTLAISSNDSSQPSYVVSLTGTGAAVQPLACGFTLGSDIYAKWIALGGQSGVLGCATANESEAAKSPQGTTGRTASFVNGAIYWHRDGPFAGQAYEVHGCAIGVYTSLNFSGGIFGFPVTDAFLVDGGFRDDFQGGYIVTISGQNICWRFPAGADFTGTWSSDRGPMTIVQDSLDVSGTYGSAGTVTGTVSGTSVSLSWADSGNQGLATFNLSGDAQTFTGSYSKQSSNVIMQWNGARAAGGTTGFFTPSRIDFGTVPVQTPKTRNVVGLEPGSTPLTITQFASDNPVFQVTVGAFTLLPGGSASIPIRFTPTAPGVVTGNITITTLDPSRPNVTIKVTGTGQ